MIKILAVTPILPGDLLAPYTLGLPRIVSEMSAFNRNREVSINLNRARLQSMVRERYSSKYSHILLLDSDVVVSKECVDRLTDAWYSGTTACALTKDGKTTHVITSCGLLSMADYLSIDYLKNLSECQCLKAPSPFYVKGAVGYEVKV